MSMFEKATRMRLRFESNAGLLSVEDLWTLDLTSKTNKPNLDDIARRCHKELKTADTISFVEEVSGNDAVAQLKFDIVKHIIAVRLEERKAEASAKENRERKQKLMSILAQKQEQALHNLSEEELKKLIAESN